MNRTVGAGLPALGPRRRQSAGKPVPAFGTGEAECVGRVRRAPRPFDFATSRARAVTRRPSAEVGLRFANPTYTALDSGWMGG